MEFPLHEDGHPIPFEEPKIENEIIFVTDSVGWNEFLLAKTPNFERVGKGQPAYSHSYYTPPSIEAMFRGALPQPFDRPYWPFGKYQKYGPCVIVPLTLAEYGYTTYLLSSNILINDLTDAEKDTLSLNSYFEHYFDCNFKIKATPELISHFLSVLKEPFYAFFLTIETHVPYLGIDNNQESQIKAIEYVDAEFGKLLTGLEENDLKYPTRIHITSDHSEAWDDASGANYGHNPQSWTQYINTGMLLRLLRVYLIRGYL